MLSDGYFAISFEAFLSLSVSIIGIWLVVRQLHATWLSSQMDGFLAFSDKYLSHLKSLPVLSQVVHEEEWDSLSDKDAHARIFSSEELAQAWSETITLYEVMGVMVRKGMLNFDLVNEIFGSAVPDWWDRLGKVNRQQGIELGSFDVGKNWEWLAQRISRRRKKG